jgi:hypothetical protein
MPCSIFKGRRISRPGLRAWSAEQLRPGGGIQLVALQTIEAPAAPSRNSRQPQTQQPQTKQPEFRNSQC